MTKSRPNSTAVFATVLLAILLLPAAYMGAYYALVVHTPTFVGPFADYRIEGVEPVFRPAHWLDRKLRRDYWEPEPGS